MNQENTTARTASHGSDTVEACLERIRRSWDAGDARAYSREFSEDATYVIYLGDALVGRGEIERTHAEVFVRWQKGTRMVVEPMSTRFVGADLAIMLTRGGIGKGREVPFDKFQTFTFVRHEGRWCCSAFQNTMMSRRSRRAQTASAHGHSPGLIARLLGRAAP